MVARQTIPLEQRERFRELIHDAFELNELEFLLRTKLEVRMADFIRPTDTGRDVSFRVVTGLFRDGRLGDLIAAVKAARPYRPDIQTLCDELAAALAAAPVEPREADDEPPDELVAYLHKVVSLIGQQDVSRGYIYPLGEFSLPTGSATRQEDLFSRLWKLAHSEDQFCALVEGPYGSGKTSLLYMLGRDLAESCLRSGGDTPLPIYLPLGFVGDNGILDAIPKYVERYGLILSRGAIDRVVNGRQRVVLLLDGLDEFADRIDWERVQPIVQEIKSLQKYTRFGMIVTSRDTFFRAPPERLIFAPTHLFAIRQFTPVQVIEFIKARAPKVLQRCKETFEHNPRLAELCCSPIHLSLLTRVLSSEQAESNEMKALLAGTARPTQASDIYRVFVDQTIADSFEAASGWDAGERGKFLRDVAYDWFRDGILEKRFEWFRKRVAEKCKDLRPAEVEPRAVLVVNCSVFRSIVAGRYRFWHRSIQEYLVGEALVEDLREGRLDRWDEKPFYAEIFKTVFEIVEREGPDSLPFDDLLAHGGDMARANVFAILYRGRLPQAMNYYLRVLEAPGHKPLPRLIGVIGVGVYTPPTELLPRFAVVYGAEENTVVKAVLRKVLRRADRSALPGPPPAESDSPAPAWADPVALRAEDARAVLQPEKELTLTFRSAMALGDSFWTAVVAAIYLLALIEDTGSYALMQEVVRGTMSEEVLEAYREVAALRSLPPVDR